MRYDLPPGDLIVRAAKPLWNDQIELHVAVRTADRQYVLPTVDWNVTVNEGSLFPEPLLRLDRDAAQRLFNELWDLGLRPADGAGGLAHVDAMRAHLADLRKVVFKEQA